MIVHFSTFLNLFADYDRFLIEAAERIFELCIYIIPLFMLISPKSERLEVFLFIELLELCFLWDRKEKG
jgi:hypothetical protein